MNDVVLLINNLDNRFGKLLLLLLLLSTTAAAVTCPMILNEMLTSGGFLCCYIDIFRVTKLDRMHYFDGNFIQKKLRHYFRVTKINFISITRLTIFNYLALYYKVINL